MNTVACLVCSSKTNAWFVMVLINKLSESSWGKVSIGLKHPSKYLFTTTDKYRWVSTPSRGWSFLDHLLLPYQFTENRMDENTNKNSNSFLGWDISPSASHNAIFGNMN